MSRDIAQRRALRAMLDEMLHPGMGEGDKAGVEAAQTKIKHVEARWPDTRLMDAHGQPDDEDAAVERDAIPAETQR